MQRALCNMLMTENGTEKLDNELTTTLFENITTLAQLHQFTRAEGKTTKIPLVTRPEETSHNSIGHGTQVSTRIRTHNSFQSCVQHLSRSVVEELNVRSCFASQFLDTFVPDHPTISNLTFRSHSPSVDVFACYVSTLDQCWVLIVRRRNNHTKLKCVVAWLEYIIEFDTLFLLFFFCSFNVFLVFLFFHFLPAEPQKSVTAGISKIYHSKTRVYLKIQFRVQI